MARTTTRRPETDDDEVMDEVEEIEDDENEGVQAAAPAVSDSRRRRQMKRGDYVEPEASVVVRKDRPTPSQREREEVVKSNNPIVRVYENIVEYFRETASELRKVTWLSREDTVHLAYIVIVVTAVSAAFLGLISFIFGYLTQLVATQGSSVVAGIVAIALIVVVTGLWLFRETLFGSHFEQ